MSAADRYRQLLEHQHELGDVMTDATRLLQKAEAEELKITAEWRALPDGAAALVAAQERVVALRAAAEQATAAFRKAQAAAGAIAVVLRPEPPRTSWPRAHSRRAVR